MRRFRACFTRVMTVALTAGLLLLPACKNNGQRSGTTNTSAAPQSATATVAIDTGEGMAVFRVELAIKPEEFQRGLMFRTDLAQDAGMLFVSKFPQKHTFWMKNTLIPLDMIFIGGDRRIVGVVENAEPQTLIERSVPALSQYVLEIPGGASARKGIHEGQQVVFQGVPNPN
jgi:uncharacterized membrane protein (UPF0127 family)